MCYEEIEVIKELLLCLQPRNCLEWGAGYSDIYFPKFVNKYAKWYSIEHDVKWFNEINAINRKKNVNMFLVQPNHFPWTDEHSDGSYSDLSDYIEFPFHLGKFDFILIDGRARKDCLVKCFNLINDKGIIVLHDAERKYYHEPFAMYRYQVMLSDYNYGNSGSMLWIGSKTLDVTDIINNSKFRKLWKAYNKLGRISIVKKNIFFTLNN